MLPCIQAAAQVPGLPADPLEFTRLKDFRALRASSNNPDPLSNDDSLRPLPGETVTLADLRGPGMVTHIWLTVAANEYGWPRLMRLRVYYDGSSTPSVDAPVGDFFAVGHGLERPVNSLMVRDGSSGRSRNCYWAMPFRKSCRITITNEGRRRVSNLYYHVDWRKMASLPADAGYFHALYRQALPAPAGRPYEVLAVRGKGHYVGTVLNVIQNQPGWFGEGDDLFYVDGEKTAGIQGTGTEDYFNDAWSLRVAEGPYAGVPVAEGTGVGSRMTAYRWHLADPVPFTQSLRFVLEHAGWTYNTSGTVRSAFEERADLFSSVAFWYQAGVAADLPEPPYGAARLPHGNARQIEVEDLIGDVRAERGKAEVERDVFWSRDVLHFRSEGKGSRIHIPLDVAEEGEYELLAQLAHSPGYGDYTVVLDGRSLGEHGELEHEPGANAGGAAAVSGYYTELYVAEDHPLGRARLAKGRHTVTFVCAGKDERSSGYDLGIDTLVLARIGSPQAMGGARAAALRRLRQAGPLSVALSDGDGDVREAAAWSLTQMGMAAAPALGRLTSALEDSDLVVRGLAAIALRNLGPAAHPALGALVARLRDPDTGVRMMAAEAIARQGTGAVPALPALMAAGAVKGEHPHVQRSVANALGAMGPAARRALPLLREFQAIPRVNWAASAAIRRIEGAGGR